MMDLFNNTQSTSESNEYTAKDIEVLEGLEPVRKRPGMYIGGTDENALHHLVSEVFDNSMDEAIAGHANRIEVELSADGFITIKDNGRGIPVDAHAKFPDKSALEVILTTLHAGGKFSTNNYQTSGGLNGVGISVVNALSEQLEISVIRDRTLWEQSYERGHPTSPLRKNGEIRNRRGTSIRFRPDKEIFGTQAHFKPARLYQFVKSKAYLYRGVEIRWSCDPALLTGNQKVPETDTLHFPAGLCDYLNTHVPESDRIIPEIFSGEVQFSDTAGKVEWAITWRDEEDSSLLSYCNTIPTPLGGTHVNGLRSALLKAIRAYGEITGNKKTSQITADDILGGSSALLSIFISEPQFQGQTKDKLVSTEASRLVENAIRDYCDHWLSGHTEMAEALLNACIEKAELRLSRKQKRTTSRKSITQRIRLPGKLTDCTQEAPYGTEIFLVEGDSAGGSAKQARDRKTQAILPLRGKILNVISSTEEKIRNNQELSDITLALGCGSGSSYEDEELRYEKVIIMTDADVDGAHIASLLMTYFYHQMRPLIENGHLYLAQPPLFKLTQAGKSWYANDEKDKEKLLKKLSKKRDKIEISRFKGLGEMTAPQLKETTMEPSKRRLLRVMLPEDKATSSSCVQTLMGKKPELRFQFIQEQALLQADKIEENLDI